MGKTRKKHAKTEYDKQRTAFRSVSDRHVLVLEADLTETQSRRIYGIADALRILENKLTAKVSGRTEQLFRTKEYKRLQVRYRVISDRLKAAEKESNTSAKNELNKELTKVKKAMEELQKKYKVTWDDTRSYMEYLRACDLDNRKAPKWKGDTGSAALSSIFALSAAENVWAGVEKILYSTGEKLHFHKRGDLPAIEAKQSNRGIIIKPKDGNLAFSVNGIGEFTCKSTDRFQSDELRMIHSYMENPDGIDNAAAMLYKETGIKTDTYRPCYASLVCRVIRGKLRVFVHVTLEGKPVPKYKPDGKTPRHAYGTGRVGADIGTQTVAYASNNHVGLKNLADRGMLIRHQERQERRLNRAMDRSRRATNPGNYNTDGTVKKGKKVWVKSKRYLLLQRKHAELCRKNAASREYANNETAHFLRRLGDELITEKMNFKALQKKAKPQNEDTSEKCNGGKEVFKAVNQDSPQPVKKHTRRKRFGKSIKNRCPGAFTAKLKQVFGDGYHEVDKMYRASQYDHTCDGYIKKKLSQRMYRLSDGTDVQRDMYSAYLLKNADYLYEKPDHGLCASGFSSYIQKQENEINRIKNARIHVLNSGIAI